MGYDHGYVRGEISHAGAMGGDFRPAMAAKIQEYDPVGCGELLPLISPDPA